MKQFFFTTSFCIALFNPSLVFSQSGMITNSVLSELDYFSAFIDKFYPQSSENVFVIKVDSVYNSFATDTKHYLVSFVNSAEVLEYIQPNYAFIYKKNWYVVKTQLKIDGKQSVELKEYTNAQADLRKYTERIIVENPVAISAFFPYCFFFKTTEGKVFGGMDIGSCDPYFNSSENDIFFYNNDDVERVNGKKY